MKSTTYQIINKTSVPGTTLHDALNWLFTNGGGGGGVTDHGALTGLADDDHTQYFNQTRGDARYSLLGHIHSNASAGSAGFMSATDFTKLAGIAAGATANATDAALRDRATHTGTQAISTVSGLQTALDGKEPLITAGTPAQYRRGDNTWQTLNGAAVANTPAGGVAATTVQAAINELDTEKFDKTGGNIAGNALVTGGVLGYGAGAGGTVTQSTSKSTAVTLNKPTGRIVMNAAELAAGASVEFGLNNSTLSPADGLVVNPDGFTGYAVEVAYYNTSTQVVLRVTNRGATRSDAVTIIFRTVKGSFV